MFITISSEIYPIACKTAYLNLQLSEYMNFIIDYMIGTTFSTSVKYSPI